MRFFLVITMIVMTVGCAAPIAKVDIPNLSESSTVSVIDLRPETEREYEIFSYSIASDAYGIYRRGDKVVDPNPVRLFQHKVYEKYSKTGSLPNVKIHHLVVYLNSKSELRRGLAGGLVGGAVGALIASGTQKYGIDSVSTLTTNKEFNAYDKEYKRALYTQEENPDKVSVYKVYLEAELDGKRTFITTMTPARLPKGVKRDPHVAAVETAMAFFLDQY